MKTIFNDRAPDSFTKHITIMDVEITDSNVIADRFNKYSTGIAQELIKSRYTTYQIRPSLALPALTPSLLSQLTQKKYLRSAAPLKLLTAQNWMNRSPI